MMVGHLSNILSPKEGREQVQKKVNLAGQAVYLLCEKVVLIPSTVNEVTNRNESVREWVQTGDK